MGSSLVPSRVRGQPRRSRGFTTQRLPLTGPAPLSRHAADRAGKTMLFVLRPRTPGQIDLGAMMTCFVSRVRATRCGHPAGLSRRGPLCSVPRRTGWPRIEALVRWTIGKPTGHHPYPTMLLLVLDAGMGQVCARDECSCALGKGGKCFEDRIMEGRRCWRAW